MEDGVRTLAIDWSGPFRLKDFRAGGAGALEAQRGLYVFSTRQLLWSPVPLLRERLGEQLEYIGLTTASFWQRCAGERSDAYGFVHPLKDVRIHLGVLRVDHDSPDYKALLRDAEGLLIAAHRPPRNSVGKAGFRGRPLRLVNAGEIGLLDAEVCSSRLPAGRRIRGRGHQRTPSRRVDHAAAAAAPAAVTA
jgi:hypothetical protein